MTRLLQAAKAPTTWTSYDRSIQSFKRFYFSHYSTHCALPYTPQAVAAFISHLSLLNQAPSTIATHLSALAHAHKLLHLPDPTQSYLVRQIQLGSRRLNPTHDTRQPITKSILHQLLESIPLLSPSPYMSSLYRSLFLLSFYAFLRAGEATVSGPQSLHTLRMSNILISQSNSHLPSLTITFTSYKHSNGSPYVITIPTQPPPCPVQSLRQFLQYRGESPGFLYLTPLNLPLSRHQLAAFLTLTLQYSGYDPKLYNTHSFRIGAASHAASQGFTPLQIQRMGRWRSDAVLKYLRHPVINNF